MTLTIAGIAGSLRHESFNQRLLMAAAAALPPGAELARWDLLAEVPPFSEDAEAGPAPFAVAALRRVIARSAGLLIATPEYNGSVPGVLKNAIDWASRPRGASVLAGKPAAVISASPSPGGAVQAQHDLRRILAVAGAQVTGASLSIAGVHRSFGPDDRLSDPALAAALMEVLAELTATAAGQPAPVRRSA